MLLQLKVCPKSQCISLCVVIVEGVPEESVYISVLQLCVRRVSIDLCVVS